MISSIGCCMPYGLVVPLTKEYRDTGMACSGMQEYIHTERDQLWSTLLLKVAHEGYRYKYPSDLRSAW